MQKEKGISTLYGLIIILMSALFLIGGSFVYQCYITKEFSQINKIFEK